MMECPLWFLLRQAVEAGASDLHLCGDEPPRIRCLGVLQPLQQENPAWLASEELFRPVLTEQHRQRLRKDGECDLACQLPEGQRFRIHLFRSGGTLAASIRLIPSVVPTCEGLGLPPVIRSFAEQTQGLILITGATGSGKSTTLAAILDEINRTRPVHILTLEDPVEYRFRPDKSLIHQREVGRDTRSFASGLRAALREDPDVIMVGELRDEETMATALTAAETGHLVLGTLHTSGAIDAVHRVLDAFPDRSRQVQTQLAASLSAVVSQRLLRRRDGTGRIGAYEILVMTDAMRHLVREGRTEQMRNFMQTGSRLGMQTLEQDLAALRRKALI
ncbi:MAG: type IV pilus twitching motility protein PilT [Succiniclasticum sp.]|jgi:twitching motility protein PilT